MREGFALVPQVLGAPEQQALLDILGQVTGAGRRGLLRIPEVFQLASSERLLLLVGTYLPAQAHPVRAIYFDKSPEANWHVAWHQDLTIAVEQRVDLPGYGPWSVKDGMVHVQPPIKCLEEMLTVRIHLDDADESNGALRVLPGTHTLGRLGHGQIQELRSGNEEVLCVAHSGDALLMRPLLLHASGRSTSPRHRRVLHIEYAGFALPAELRWNAAA